jgi:aspartyl-tRNA(Asn)/glutamyl-tRNA(Gln) amidotransferase subunit B
MNYETVIGLEVHAELNTVSKVFCNCPTQFGGVANTRICPVCTGHPGSLPKLNERVVEYAVKLGLALGCEITKNCNFDRKNYFYPDLPKAYQISQLYFPICVNGALEIEADGVKKRVGIREIHIEEDAGKLEHEGNTQIDFNRAGIPLLEIVTHPDLSSAEEVVAFIEKLRGIMLYLEISDCKMQEGSLRADVNLSIRKAGDKPGSRTETKNLNSLKAVARAIKYEAERQEKILISGGRVIQETRRWKDEENKSYPMRSKENAEDYRYFPEPDLPPLCITDEWIEDIKRALPEFAHQKQARFCAEYGIPPVQSEIICKSKNIAALFEKVARGCGSGAEAANLITGDIMRLLNETGQDPEELKADPEKLAYLAKLVLSGKINRGAYKETVEAVLSRNADPQAYITEKGLFSVSDDAVIVAAVKETLSKNPGAVEDFKAGKDKAFGYLMGQTMKNLSGKGDPATVKRILAKELAE